MGRLLPGFFRAFWRVLPVNVIVNKLAERFIKFFIGTAEGLDVTSVDVDGTGGSFAGPWEANSDVRCL